MIPYEQLCDALAQWRTKNGIAPNASAKPQAQTRPSGAIPAVTPRQAGSGPVVGRQTGGVPALTGVASTPAPRTGQHKAAEPPSLFEESTAVGGNPAFARPSTDPEPEPLPPIEGAPTMDATVDTQHGDENTNEIDVGVDVIDEEPI